MKIIQLIAIVPLFVHGVIGKDWLPKSPGPQNPAVTLRHNRKVRILFIGNSATYFHNLPGIIQSIAASDSTPIQIQTELIAEGGQTLEGHWREGKAQREIRAKQWDYVVLQEQSGLNDELKVNGVDHIVGWESYLRFAKMFDTEAKAAGAKTVILSLWAHKGAPSRDQQALDYASQELARETHAILVPAGGVWHAVERKEPGVQLYNDSFHPTRTASYMFAVSFYSTVFRRDPKGLASKATGLDISIENKSGDDPNAILAEVPKDLADEIKRTAYDVVRRGAGRVAEPEGLSLPSLPSASPVTSDQLTGTWEGTSTSLTSTPVPFTLAVSTAGDRIYADTRLVLKSPIEDKHIAGGIDGNVVWFENPKGVDGAFVRYRAVLIHGEIIGTAEYWLHDKLSAIGSFRGKRSSLALKG